MNKSPRRPRLATYLNPFDYAVLVVMTMAVGLAALAAAGYDWKSKVDSRPKSDSATIATPTP